MQIESRPPALQNGTDPHSPQKPRRAVSLDRYHLTRHFDKLMWQSLDRHPELLPVSFGNYTKIVHLAQTRDEDMAKKALSAARKLGLHYGHRFTGYGELEDGLQVRSGANLTVG